MLSKKKENKDLRIDLNEIKGKLESQLAKNRKRLKAIELFEIDIFHYLGAEDIKNTDVVKLGWKLRKLLILRRNVKETILRDGKMIEALNSMISAFKKENGSIKDYRAKFLKMEEVLNTEFDDPKILNRIELINDSELEVSVDELTDEVIEKVLQEKVLGF
jgi:hypothetical protein